MKQRTYWVPLDIPIPPEVWCFSYIVRVQLPSQQVALDVWGLVFGSPTQTKIHSSLVVVESLEKNARLVGFHLP